MSLLLSSLFAGGAAIAQQTTTLPEIAVTAQATPGSTLTTGATKTNTSVLELPQAISVVTQESLRARSVRTAKEALDTVSSVVAGQGEGRRDEFYIRGFYSLRDVSLDGVRDDNLYTRDLATTERIEVIKGSAAALYGRGSAGGLINRISKKPQARQATEVTLGLASHSARRVSIDTGGALSANVNARLIGVHDSGDSYRDEVRHRRRLIAPSLAVALDPRSSLLIQAEVQREERTPDRGVPSLNGRPLSVPARTFYGERYDFTNTDNELIRASFAHQFDAQAKLSHSLQYSHGELTGVNTRNRSVDATAGTLRRQITYFPQEQRNLISQTELTWVLPGHTVLAGLELARQSRDVLVRQTGVGFPASLYAPEPSLPAPDLATLPVTLDTAFVARTHALYLQDQIDLNLHWKALLGMRAERFGQRQHSRLRGERSERNDDVVSPRVGLVYQIREHQSLYMNLARSFQPGGGELLYTGTTALAEVKPMQTTLQELGYKQDWLGRSLFTTVSLFRIEQRNQLTQNPLDPMRPLQVGKQRNQGVELELQGKLWRGSRIDASYTYNDARITASLDPAIKLGARAEMTPRQRASIWLDQTIGQGLSVGAGVLGSSDQYALSDNTVRLPGYVRVDAALNYRTARYDVRVKVSNVTDAHFHESAINNIQIQPGAPRSVHVTVSSLF